jgi:hypothetical protein
VSLHAASGVSSRPKQSLTVDLSLLKSVAQSYAVIDNSKAADLCAIFAQGDRRRRPMGWMRRSDVETLYQYGHLKPVRKGVAFTYAAERALIENRWALRPDIGLNEGEDQVVYVPSAVQRRVKRRNSGHILRRLAKDRDGQGHPYLSASEIEAGAQFQRDYERAYGAAFGSQNFTPTQVDYTRQNQEEIAVATRLDAGKAYQKAKAVLGAGLDQAADIICGDGKSFAAVEREQTWARGAGRTILKLALQRLADHYGTQPGQIMKRT